MGDWSELKKLAEAATPGPWNARDYGSYDGNGSHWFLDTEKPHDIADDQDGTISPNHWDDDRGERDMKFIAAANPKTILELIAENEKLAADTASLEFVRWSHKVNRDAIEAAGHETICDLAAERDQLKAENEAMRLRIVECNGYLQCVVDQSMSRNNAEALAIELIEGNGKVTDR